MSNHVRIDGVAAEAKGRSAEGLGAERDALLAAIVEVIGSLRHPEP